MLELRLQSFPFDSNWDGYDDEGYPVYDRAVSARPFRTALEKIFTDGVFGTPANALQIAKGSGLSVTVQPGMGVIRGAMGGVYDDAATVQLDTAAPQGNTAYAVMLRCDDNLDRRSLFLYVEKGEAASTPEPPEPLNTDVIKDLRLGYVVVPSGATDLSNATVTNEKGLAVCPYAAPFAEIDMSEVTADAAASANEALTALVEYFDQYKGVVDSALSETEAGYLQQQISAIQEQLANTDLGGSVDNETIEYATAPLETGPKLRVKDSGVGTDQIADGAVTSEKIGSEAVETGNIKDSSVTEDKFSDYVLYRLGWLSTNGWDFDRYEAFILTLNGTERTAFINSIPSDDINSWTVDQLSQLAGEISYSDASIMVKKYSLENIEWTALVASKSKFTGQLVDDMFIGKYKTMSMGAYGNQRFQIVDMGHYDLASGSGTDNFVFLSEHSFGNASDTGLPYWSYPVNPWEEVSSNSRQSTAYYGTDKTGITSSLWDYVETTLADQIDATVAPIVKQVKVPCMVMMAYSSGGSTTYTRQPVNWRNTKFFAPAWDELNYSSGDVSPDNNYDGPTFSFFDVSGKDKEKVCYRNGTTTSNIGYWTRSINGSGGLIYVSTNGSVASGSYSDRYAVPVVFCL